ncbi:MAG: serine/threonine-protein kinase [Verrucomicrobia bacterium]|nr:serine/threonine-protein kinase [Verrucomicrobiota bacterium]
MPTPEPFPSPVSPSTACPRCGGSSASPFVTAGVCLRCAGERVLALDFFAEPTPIPDAGETAPMPDRPDDLPRRIGPYEIIDEIGQGGMGCVYAARQSGLGRIVALKALPEGRGGAAGLELRFLREARTAARLRHPHIVSVHDSGRADGFVYFTMDYLEGGDLAHRLRERPFTPRAAAALVQKLAGALAYTHAEGVLHRDVKPSNILLDGEEPRLADFGLAAQLEPGGDLTAASGVLGTPHYVAPEALRSGSAALSATSDLYALGVVLYELLTGRTAFAGAAPAELAHLIATTEVPPPRLLAPAVPRDLETICLRCLEVEPGRRHPDAAALGEDLRRFLAGEPILSHAPGAWDAVRKFSRRHRVLLGAVAAIGAVLVGATAVSVTLAVRARQAERAAADEAATSKALADFLESDLLEKASPGEQSRTVTLHEILQRAAGKIDGRFPSQPLVAAELHGVIGQVFDTLGDFAAARNHLERARALRLAQLGAGHPLTLSATSLLGAVLGNAGQPAEGEKLLTAALEGRRRLLGAEAPETLATANLLALSWRDLGRFPEAAELLVSTLETARRVLPAGNETVLRALNTLASIRLKQRRTPEAEALAREAAELSAKSRGAEHLATLTVLSDLAVILREAGKTAESTELHERVLEVRRRRLGPEHPHTAISLSNLAGIRKDEGRFAEAEAMQAEALAISGRAFGPTHLRTLTTMRNLADTYRLQGELGKSEALMTETLALSRKALTNDHPHTMNTLASLGDLLVHRARYAEAEPLLRESLAAYEHDESGAMRANAIRAKLGHALAQLGRYSEAEPLLLAGYAGMTQPGITLPPSYRRFVSEAGQHIVELYTAWQRPDEADLWRKKTGAAAAPGK